MAKYDNILEEELKNKVAKDYFSSYDGTQIIGKIDFCIAIPRSDNGLFETEYLLWAEAKAGTKKDIYESFVQLILTIGKARTYEKYLPPAFLGAFDAEKIAFFPYADIIEVFCQSDFNWNVAPSDHGTVEFRLIYGKVKAVIDREMLLYRFGKDDKELHGFIRRNFMLGKSEASKIRINKNNFTHIYWKWTSEVKPSIGIDWEIAKKEGLIDADFYLADILSEHNTSLRDKLFVLLRSDRYVYNIRRKDTGSMSYEAVDFNDKQVAHTRFWNKYDRPPRREYWDYIVERRDLLVPQDVRERKGSYFTPRKWVELSQRYIADELGEGWQDKYYVWDCAAGTGNLLIGLTDKYKVWASTIDEQDVKVMHDLIGNNKLNLLEKHVFRFDFLNDPFSSLPDSLQEIISNEEKRKKLIVFINPPYAEASDKKTLTGGKGKNAVEQSAVNLKYRKILGQGNAELFAQFLTRIYLEIPSCILAEFSTLKILQGPHFSDFRKFFSARLCRIFVIPADTFDNVKGKFPIGFMIWKTGEHAAFRETEADVYDREGHFMGKKRFCACDSSHYMNEWVKKYRGRKGDPDNIGKFPFKGNDFQNQDMIQIVHPNMKYNQEAGQFYINKDNVLVACVYFAVRKSIEGTWLNNQDQFLWPDNGWEADGEFQTDCLAYTLFNNKVRSEYGVNHWIPFTEKEVDAKEKFRSNFMSDFIAGKTGYKERETKSLFENGERVRQYSPLAFSREARALTDAGRELWRYYHARPDANPNASLYDIRLHFQGKDKKGKMNNESADSRYMNLIGSLRQALKSVARKIEPKIYDYGFLRR